MLNTKKNKPPKSIAKKEEDVNQNVYCALGRIAEAMKDLDDIGSSLTTVQKIVQDDVYYEPIVENSPQFHPVYIPPFLPLRHWRLTSDQPVLNEAYKMITEGTEFLKTTSTKYTLMGKAAEDGDFKGLPESLLEGIQIIATGAMVLHSEEAGCGRCCRTHAKRSVRRLISATISLVQSFLDKSALDDNVGAIKTATLWETCDDLVKIPRGNRNAVRRDVLLWRKDATETLEEFQVIVNLGPKQNLQEESEPLVETGWDDFCEGNEVEQYSKSEIEIVDECLALIKCSRVTLGLILEVCDLAAAKIEDNSNSFITNKLEWIGQLTEVARIIGTGVTDLGMHLYPPLNANNAEFLFEVKQQSFSVATANDVIIRLSSSMDLSTEAFEKATKLKVATLDRYQKLLTKLNQDI